MSVIDAADKFKQLKRNNEIQKLMDHIEESKQAVLDDPLSYLDEAHEVINNQRHILTRLVAAVEERDYTWMEEEQTVPPSCRTITITQDAYDRFQKVMDLIPEIKEALK